MTGKFEEARASAENSQRAEDEVLPAYSPLAPGPSIDSPFDFPSDPPPAFASSSSTPFPSRFPTSAPPLHRPIAIPQTAPSKTAPFLSAYSRPLLHRGITPETWRSFLNTLSAFLAARVSDQALAHAADVGRHVADVPRRFGRQTADHARYVGDGIRDRARAGNLVGAAVGAVGGAIALPVSAALRAVGAAVSLPRAVVGAATQKPRTPRERAEAYVEAANLEWLAARGLRASIVNTAELETAVRLQRSTLLTLTRASTDQSATRQLAALHGYIAELETSPGSELNLGEETIWLLVFQDGRVAQVATEQKDAKN